MQNYECKVESKSPIRRELTITVKPEAIQETMDKQLKQVQKKAKLKGFREGKVPLSLVKQYFGEDVKSDVFSKVIRETYIRALEDNKIFAVGTPEIEAKSGMEMKEGESLTFVAKIEVFPEIKLADLSKVKVERASGEVTDEDIEKSIENLRSTHAEIVPNAEYKGPARQGDFADISFKGTLNGQELDSLKGENRLVEIGAKQYMEEFEHALIGLSSGQSKDFDLEFPKDFSDENLAGKTVKFNVVVHEFKKKQLPELDDEFAKRFKIDSALELRKKMSESMREERSNQAREALKESLMKGLVEAHKFEVPQGLINSQLEYLVKENVTYLKRNGFTDKMAKDYLDKNRDELVKRAEEQVRASLILDKISQEQDIKVVEADLEHEYTKMGERLNIKPEQVRQLYGNDENAVRQLRYRIKEERAIEWALGQVKVTDVKA